MLIVHYVTKTEKNRELSNALHVHWQPSEIDKSAFLR
jgi:hypothetical protein